MKWNDTLYKNNIIRYIMVPKDDRDFTSGFLILQGFQGQCLRPSAHLQAGVRSGHVVSLHL